MLSILLSAVHARDHKFQVGSILCGAHPALLTSKSSLEALGRTPRQGGAAGEVTTPGDFKPLEFRGWSDCSPPPLPDLLPLLWKAQ